MLNEDKGRGEARCFGCELCEIVGKGLADAQVIIAMSLTSPQWRGVRQFEGEKFFSKEEKLKLVVAAIPTGTDVCAKVHLSQLEERLRWCP